MTTTTYTYPALDKDLEIILQLIYGTYSIKGLKWSNASVHILELFNILLNFQVVVKREWKNFDNESREKIINTIYEALSEEERLHAFRAQYWYLRLRLQVLVNKSSVEKLYGELTSSIDLVLSLIEDDSILFQERLAYYLSEAGVKVCGGGDPYGMDYFERRELLSTQKYRNDL